MNSIALLTKKVVLVTVVLALGLAALPLSGVSAAAPNDPATPPVVRPDNSRLERVWAREQARYQREGNLLARADDFIARVQTLLDKAKQKGWDVSAVQAALDAFSSVIPAAQAAHEPGAAIIRTHAGFNANGQVIDRATAIATVKSLRQVLVDTRTALNGTSRALIQAIRDFRQAHRPAATPTP